MQFFFFTKMPRHAVRSAVQIGSEFNGRHEASWHGEKEEHWQTQTDRPTDRQKTPEVLRTEHRTALWNVTERIPSQNNALNSLSLPSTVDQLIPPFRSSQWSAAVGLLSSSVAWVVSSPIKNYPDCCFVINVSDILWPVNQPIDSIVLWFIWSCSKRC